MASSANFADAAGDGDAGNDNASYSDGGVRPIIIMPKMQPVLVAAGYADKGKPTCFGNETKADT